jgi:alkylation response protein AidB-like acyl-CoA dehydrogenase
VDASIGQLLAYHYINAGNIGFTADPATQDEWHRKNVEGRWIWGDSVNPTDPDLPLTQHGDAFRLNGLKRFSTGASAGDVILVNAVVRGGDHDGTIFQFVLDHDRAGITYLGDWDALGQRLSASGSVRFEDVLVEQTDILGTVGDEPFSSLVTPGIQLAFGNLYLGIAEGALKLAGEYAQIRKTFGKPICEHQAIQLKLGEMATRARAARLLTLDAAQAFDRGDRCDMEAGMAKYFATEAALENSIEGLRIHGAYGYSKEFDIERLYRDAPLTCIGEGTNEMQRIIIAKQWIKRNPV